MRLKRDGRQTFLLLVAISFAIEVGLGWTLYLLFWHKGP
jgi:hypothetical protein